MNIPDSDFKELLHLVCQIIDGPEQGAVTRDDVDRSEFALLKLLTDHGGVVYGQKFEYLRRKFSPKP